MQITKIDVLKILNNICMTYMLVWMIETYYLDGTVELAIGNLALVAFVILNDTLFVNSGKLFMYTLGRVISLALLVFLSQFTIGAEPKIAVGIICVLLSYYGYMTDNIIALPKLQIIFYYVALYVIGFFTGNKRIYPVALLFVVVTALLSVLLYNELNMQRHYLILKGQNMVPYDKIKGTNRMMMVISVIITCVMAGMAILADYGDKIYQAMRSGLIAFLTWLFSFLPKEVDEAVYEETTKQEAIDYSDLLQSVPQKDNKFLDAFWQAMTVVLYFAAVLILIYLVYKIAIAFYERFNMSGKKASRDKTESLNPREEKEKIQKSKRYNESRIPFFATSTDMKIRRMYFKFIKAMPHSDDIRDYHTPKELEIAAGGKEAVSGRYDVDNSEESFAEIHRLYEKARYNPEACQNSDVAMMKQLTAKR